MPDGSLSMYPAVIGLTGTKAHRITRAKREILRRCYGASGALFPTRVRPASDYASLLATEIDSLHLVDNTQTTSHVTENAVPGENITVMAPSKLAKLFAKEEVVKAAGTMLLALPRPYYLAIPAACILLSLYLFAFPDSSPTYVRLPSSSVPNPSPSAGPALSDMLSTHGAGNATLGVSILSLEFHIHEQCADSNSCTSSKKFLSFPLLPHGGREAYRPLRNLRACNLRSLSNLLFIPTS